MFTAYVNSFTLPYYIYDSRSRNNVSGGVHYTLDSGASTDTLMVCNTSPARPPSVTSWIGAHFMIVEVPSSSKDMLYTGGLIVNETVSGGFVTNFTLAVPLLRTPPVGTKYVIIKHQEASNITLQNDCIDLRKFIREVSWTTSIVSGFDTATIMLNDSAYLLGKFYTQMLGQDIEIYDVWGNFCWNGIIVDVYIDGGGGRIDCVGYKKTFDWFRFERAYLPANAETGFHSGDPGPTTVKIVEDVVKSNPYVNKTALWGINHNVRETQLFVSDTQQESPTVLNTYNYPETFHESQLRATNYKGLGILDYSDGSYKCSDVLATLEEFGYYADNRDGFIDGISRDSIHIQCWRGGQTKIQRVFKAPAFLAIDYRIGRNSIRGSYANVEIAGDINDIATEVYIIYSDENGDQRVSVSTYNYDLIRKLGIRTETKSTSAPKELAAIMSQNSMWDKSFLVGIGSVQITGNVKGCGITPLESQLVFIPPSTTYRQPVPFPYKQEGHQGNNTPAYLIKAGSVVEFEENIGLASLYRNKWGLPGVFYVGATSFSSSSGITTITPATTLSVADMFATRTSNITN